MKSVSAAPSSATESSGVSRPRLSRTVPMTEVRLPMSTETLVTPEFAKSAMVTVSAPAPASKRSVSNPFPVMVPTDSNRIWPAVVPGLMVSAFATEVPVTMRMSLPDGSVTTVPKPSKPRRTMSSSAPVLIVSAPPPPVISSVPASPKI